MRDTTRIHLDMIIYSEYDHFWYDSSLYEEIEIDVSGASNLVITITLTPTEHDKRY